MTKPTPIIDMTGQHEEAIERRATNLGRDKLRRRVFNEIYGRTRKMRSVKEIATAMGIADENSNFQRVRNALDRLANHHLIAKSDNNGHSKDGSRYVYGKEPSVNGYKDKIIRFADNPQAAKAIPTKRRPIVQRTTTVKKVAKQTLRKQKHLNVLYLTANPDPKNPLQVDLEYKMVQQGIRGSRFRDNITLYPQPAADLNSLLQGLNDHRPQIIHFSGHGNEYAIATDAGKLGKPTAQLLSFNLLSKALAATDSQPDVIILNSCKSSAAKKTLLTKVKIIITMRESVSDIAAANFAQTFYAAIASGQSVKSAFEQGKVAVENASISDADVPEIHCANSIDPARIVLT